MTTTEIVQVITGCLGSLGFSVLFNLRGVRLLTATIGGFLSWFLFVVFSKFAESDVVCYFLVAAAVSVFAEIMARHLKTPTTTFITAALIPLIPGGSLYYTMASAMGGDMLQFLEKGIHTVKLASALALGIIVTTVLTKLVINVSAKRQKLSLDKKRP